MSSLTWWHYFACLTTLKFGLGQNSTKPKNMHMRSFRTCCLLFRPHLNLPRLGSFLMLHLLPCLTTFNIVGYITEREIISHVVFHQYATPLHNELHLICRIVCALCHALFHTWLCIMPCSCVGCLLCCVLLSGVCFLGLDSITSHL